MDLPIYGVFSETAYRRGVHSAIYSTPFGKSVIVTTIIHAPDEAAARYKLDDYFRDYPDTIFMGRLLGIEQPLGRSSMPTRANIIGRRADYIGRQNKD